MVKGYNQHQDIRYVKKKMIDSIIKKNPDFHDWSNHINTRYFNVVEQLVKPINETSGKVVDAPSLPSSSIGKH